MTGASDSTHRIPPTNRVAALLYLFLGAAFGLSVPFVLAHFGGSVPDAADLVRIQPSTLKRHLADLRVRMGLTTE